MSAQQVRTAYRHLLKTQRRRFAGDETIISAARDQTRKEFEASRSLTEPKQIEKRLKHALEVEKVIRQYVVQAPRSSEKPDTFEVKFTPEHALRDRHPILVKSSLQKDSKQKP